MQWISREGIDCVGFFYGKIKMNPNVSTCDPQTSAPHETIANNRRVLLQSRPHGVPKRDDFRMEVCPTPVPGPDEVLLRTLYLSLDPYMRGRMSDEPSYAEPVPVGGVMEGGTISRVEHSNRDDFEAGDLVLGYGGWQDFSISTGKGLTRLDANIHKTSLALGVLGMPGFTAYMGLLDIGQPKKGETVVVAAATGAVGSVVGQIAKIRGCRAVGIAGGAEKCRFAVEELGFDECIDRHDRDLAKRLKLVCPAGIDVYFESVGGKVFDAVLPLLNPQARVPLCGLISSYNDSGETTGPDRLGSVARVLLTKRIKVQGFIIFEDYANRFDEFASQMGKWVRDGDVKFREDIVDGLENAPDAFIGMLAGKNFGKLVVHVSNG